MASFSLSTAFCTALFSAFCLSASLSLRPNCASTGVSAPESTSRAAADVTSERIRVRIGMRTSWDAAPLGGGRKHE